MSWPPEETQAVSLVDSLDPADAQLAVNWRTEVLKDETELSQYLSGPNRVKPFLEPTLCRRPMVYADFCAPLKNPV